jgi:hypothetical protein
MVPILKQGQSLVDGIKAIDAEQRQPLQSEGEDK